MVLQTEESVLKLFSAYKSHGCLKASQGSRARLTLGIVDICLLCRILAKQRLGIEFHWLQSHHFNAVHGEVLKHHLLFADILSSIVKRILSRRDSMPQSHRKRIKQAQKQVALMSLVRAEYVLRQFCCPWKIFKSLLAILVRTKYVIESKTI